MESNLAPLTDKGRAALSLMAGALVSDLAARRRAKAAVEPILDPGEASADTALAESMLATAMAREVRVHLASRHPTARALFLSRLRLSGLAQIHARAERTDLHMMGYSASASTPHAALSAWADAVDGGTAA